MNKQINGKHGKRALILTHDQEPIFRFDVNINGRDFIEYDIYNALNDMDRKGLINLKKVFNMLKVKYGLTLSDSIGIYKDMVLNNDNGWKHILPEEPKENLCLKNLNENEINKEVKNFNEKLNEKYHSQIGE